MSWQEKVKNRLPNLEANEFWWVKGNIFIDDIGLENLGLSNDIPKLKMPYQVLTPELLNKSLLKVLQLDSFQVIIWPGEGAKVVRKSLGIVDGLWVAAKRIGYKDPDADVADFSVPLDQRVIIIDDVIASGVTALKVYQKGKLKKACLAAWIMQNPTDTILRCYENIFTGFVVRGDNGKVPINSLSTFLEKPEILEDYSGRYALNPQEFVEFFNWLKEEEVSRAL